MHIPCGVKLWPCVVNGGLQPPCGSDISFITGEWKFNGLSPSKLQHITRHVCIFGCRPFNESFPSHVMRIAKFIGVPWKMPGRRSEDVNTSRKNPWKTRILKRIWYLINIIFWIRVFQGIAREVSTSSRRLPRVFQEKNRICVNSSCCSTSWSKHGCGCASHLEDVTLPQHVQVALSDILRFLRTPQCRTQRQCRSSTFCLAYERHRTAALSVWRPPLKICFASQRRHNAAPSLWRQHTACEEVSCWKTEVSRSVQTMPGPRCSNFPNQVHQRLYWRSRWAVQSLLRGDNILVRGGWPQEVQMFFVAPCL